MDQEFMDEIDRDFAENGPGQSPYIRLAEFEQYARELTAANRRLEAELAEARQWKEKWETCEKWRKFYQEAKGKLYAMGGEVAEACWNNMPCNESQVDQWFRAEFVYKAAYDRVSSELAEARAMGDRYQKADDAAVQLLEKAKMTLEVPAAEYVPAISDAWQLIENALEKIR